MKNKKERKFVHITFGDELAKPFEELKLNCFRLKRKRRSKKNGKN